VRNIDKLKKIMLTHKLSISEIAKMLGIRARNIYPWFVCREKNWSRGVQDSHLRIIESKIKDRECKK